MTELIIISIVVMTFIGLVYYIIVAQSERSDKIEKFWMAGRNIGVSLFEHTTWATSHGSANSIWYAIWLGYTIGLAGIWLQSFWCLGIASYSFLIPRIIKHTENFTLHGFLGAYFGTRARLVASFVSLTGLFVCIGFEVSYVSGFYTQVLGIGQELIVPLIIGFSLFISLFCTIGGYSANVKTDRITNYFATISVIILIIVLLWYKFQNNIPIKDISIKPLIHNDWSFYVGIIFFGLYQWVDMTNWQTISANSLSQDEVSIKKMQTKIKLAALKIFLFPVCTGTIAGFLLKNITVGIAQEKILSAISANYMPSNEVITAILLGFVCLSFILASLSATNSWLLASSQTISWDLWDYKIFHSFGFKVKEMEDETHSKILSKAKIVLMLIGVIVTLIIYYVSLRWNQVFALQFVMFGAGLSMIPALIYGLYRCESVQDGLKQKYYGFLSIAFGFLTALVIFSYSIITNNPDLVNHIPLASLIVSVLFMIKPFLTSNK